MREKIYCPHCHRRLLDGNADTVAHTQIAAEVHEDKADYMIKCPRCKREIGITKKPA